MKTSAGTPATMRQIKQVLKTMCEILITESTNKALKTNNSRNNFYFLYYVLGAVRQITDKLDLKNEHKKLKNREGKFYEIYGK